MKKENYQKGLVSVGGAMVFFIVTIILIIVIGTALGIK